MSKHLLLVLAIFASCGKVQQVQEGISALTTSNDLKLVDVRAGFAFNGGAGGYDYLEYESTQYRLGDVSPSAAQVLDALPEGQRIPVYFKGQFARRSGVMGAPGSTVFDVVDLESLRRQ